MKEGKQLSERYKELDKQNAKNVVAFLYTASEDDYDLNDPMDVLELYRFATVYAKITSAPLRKRIKLLIGDKMPRIMKLADKGTKMIEDYDTITKFVELTEQNPDEAFIEFFDAVMEILRLKLNDEYSCYLRSYMSEGKDEAVVHFVYLITPAQLGDNYLRIIRLLLDVAQHNYPVTIEAIKTVNTDETPQNEEYHLYKEGNLYRID